LGSRGLVLVNTGGGKGKTTAALGTLVRALGHGQRAAFIQFIKAAATGESRFLESYARDHPESLRFEMVGLGFLGNPPSEGARAKAREGLALARKLAPGLDLMVLDEINIALDKGLVPLGDMLAFIADRPPNLSLILTGRGCPAGIVAVADTVTDMGELKHAYNQGIPAKRGIDF
jgi:cob(I)alamin adenosyltransferase